MIINSEILTILKNFSQINQSIYIRKGSEIKTLSKTGSIYACANIDQIIENDFAIYDLPNFLAAISVMKTPTLVFDDEKQYVKIKDSDGNKSINYLCTDPSLVLSPPEGKSLPYFEPIVSFSLPEGSLKGALKSMSILGLSDLAFVGNGETLSLRAIDPVKSNSNYVDVIGETDQRFTIIFKSDNMKLMEVDYNVELTKRYGKFTAGDKLTYYVSIEEKSEFED